MTNETAKIMIPGKTEQELSTEASELKDKIEESLSIWLDKFNHDIDSIPLSIKGRILNFLRSNR